MVGLQDLPPHFLLPLVDVPVELVPVLADRKLLVVVYRNVYLPVAVWLVFGIVELSNIGVFKRLLSRESLAGVEVHEVLQQVEGVVARRREQVAQTLRLCRWQRLQHR